MNKATTVRLDRDVQDALNSLSKLEGRPKNKLINDAVALYIEHEAEAIANEAETALEQIKAYRAADPDFESAIAAFAESEAQYGANDTAEGRAMRSAPSLSEKVRRLVHA